MAQITLFDLCYYSNSNTHVNRSAFHPIMLSLQADSLACYTLYLRLQRKIPELEIKVIISASERLTVAPLEGSPGSVRSSHLWMKQCSTSS